MPNLRELLLQADDDDEVIAPAKAAPPAMAQPQPTAAPAPKAALSLSSQILGKTDPVEAQAEQDRARYQRLKSKIHNRLIESLDLDALMMLDGSDQLETAIEQTVHMLINEEKLPLSAAERHQVARDVLYETLGLGPLEPLLSDPYVNDILVNGAQDVWVDKNGRLELTEIHFKDDDHLLHVINRIVARIGRRIDESSPMVDARLADGSRVNAIIPPLSIDGPVLSIRRFRPVPFDADALQRMGAFNDPMATFLRAAVAAKFNILISGGTSAGKTTLLNMLSAAIDGFERIVTIEDTAELRLQQRHVIRLESRPANSEGQGAISQRDLVKNALRMRPDRIIVGEVRGAEALDMLQAMNTGHEGSLTTVHANSARDALSRIETLVMLAGIELSQRSIREQIASAFDLVIQIKRLADGTRRVVSISEITGIEEGVIAMQNLFEWRQAGIDENGAVIGKHVGCGLRPSKETRFKEASIDLPSSLFSNIEAQ